MNRLLRRPIFRGCVSSRECKYFLENAWEFGISTDVLLNNKAPKKKTDEKGGLSFEVLSNVPMKRMDDGWKSQCVYT